ncbi:kinase-like domain-containing protein [Alternaria rosae]|uniref:kinase-like domain-containing protein n=1 Tax=Alternaria rosae TaxID=1187941 RepID=UPI001E8CC47A|nr:kinase-like domain-containing protein [Alternaria rosae]KAH6860900.1 kinase-like domain-containing protein [Alternaria rosae]
MPVTIQKGLRWKKDRNLGVAPEWTTEPSIEDVTTLVRRELKIPTPDLCVVQFLTQNKFNKAYTVTCGSSQEYVLRLTVPVDPRSKTMSEVATIKYIRHHTEIPVPQVFCHQASTANEVGLEWILMARMPGRRLCDEWKGMDYLKKEQLVRKLVSVHAQLFQQRFNRLGNLYPANELSQLSTSDMDNITFLGPDASIRSTQLALGKIVSAPFFWGKHIDHNVPRGPYKHSRDWLSAQLQLNLLDLNDESNRETSDEIKRSDDKAKNRAQRLLDLLPKNFPEEEEEEEVFVLHHHNLHAASMLVDENGELTGISDWECAHTAPLWLACQSPKILELSGSTASVSNPNPIQREIAEERNAEYDTKVKLRQVFLEEMQSVCPEWVEVHQSNQLKVGFEQVVQHFGAAGDGKYIDRWIDEVEKNGTAPLLREIIRTTWFEEYFRNGYPF